LLTIQTPEKHDADCNYLDVRIHLDWMDDRSMSLRPYAVPIELVTLMPVHWDLSPNEAEAMDPLAYFQLDEKEAKGTHVGSFRAIGGEATPNLYHLVRSTLEKANRRGWIPKSSGKMKRLEGDLVVSPAKLFASMFEFEKRVVDDAEAIDLLDLTLDKVALLALLPIIKGLLPKAIAETGEGELQIPRLPALIDKLAQTIVSDQRYSPSELGSPEFFDGTEPLTIPLAQWQAFLPALLVQPQKRCVLVPLGVLDEWLQAALDRLFDRLVASLDKDSRSRLQGAVADADPTRQITYRVLYPAIDRIRSSWHGKGSPEVLNLYKLGRRGRIPNLLPHIQEIDARPQVWAREASALAVERAIAQKACDLVLKRTFDAGSGDKMAEFYAGSAELRSANRALFEVRRNIESLNHEVVGEGFEVRDCDRPELGPFKGLEISRRVTRVRALQVPRELVQTWNENYVEHQCMGTGPFRMFRICFPVYRTRTRTEVRRWYDTVYEQYHEDIPITVDWNPIRTYLGAALSDRTYEVRTADGQRDAAKTEESLRLVRRVLGKTDAEPLLNGQKDVRVFELHDNGYRDQKGFSIEHVLREAESEQVRARLLLIIPIYERRIDGSTALLRYLAVHNPLASRKTYSAPRVFLVENYVNSFTQVPGHWLGALSHTVCLFPGEQRRLRIATETRLTSQQRQESRSSQRNAFETKSNVRTQVRAELSDQRKDAKQSNWSANVSGGATFGFGTVNASASAGGASQSSQETVAKSLNDRIDETLNSASLQNEVQFSISSDTATSEITSSEQTIEIANVNQGRSVTHKFFQVLHQFRSEVTLAGARLVIEYPEPLVPGLDLYRTETCGIDQIGELFPELRPEDAAVARQKLRELVVRRLGSAVEPVRNNEPLVFKSVKLHSMERFVNSGSYYVDTEVAQRPATEPYVEDARNAEIAIQMAKAERSRAETKAIADGQPLFRPDGSSLTVNFAPGDQHER
jgi:hypothetical protein